MGRACSTNGDKRNSFRILMGKPEGKRPLRRPRCRWVDSTKLDFREIGWDGMDWIDVAQDMDQWRGLANTVMKLPVRQNVEKSSSCTTDSLSRRAQLHRVS
jgi:hypothetical protein